MTIKELLRGKLTESEMKMAPSSFEIIGNKEKAVAIIELEHVLKPKAKIIAEAIMVKHRNVKTVLLKDSPRQGEYRTRKYRRIKGAKSTEVMHVENGCRLLVDPVSSYFSSREGTERERMIEKVKPGETVMVFFAGAGPFAIEMAKKAKPAKVIGIEINPAAVDYFVKNIKLNKLQNVEAVLGDVVERAKEFYGICDRVLMPLPEKAIDYLTDALKCLKHGGVCHLYFFSDESKLNEVKKKVKQMVKEQGRKATIIQEQRVLPYGPKIWKYRMDFIVDMPSPFRHTDTNYHRPVHQG